MASPFDGASLLTHRVRTGRDVSQFTGAIASHVNKLVELEKKTQFDSYNPTNRIGLPTSVNPFLEKSYEVWLSDDSEDEDDDDDDKHKHNSRVPIPGNEKKSKYGGCENFKVQTELKESGSVHQIDKIDLQYLLEGFELIPLTQQIKHNQFIKYSKLTKFDDFATQHLGLINGVKLCGEIMYQCNTLTHLIYINILKKDWLFVYRAFCLLCKSRLFDDRSTWGIGIECLKNLNELEFIEILKNSTKLSELELKTLIDIPYFSMSKNPVLASIGYKCDKIPFQLIKNAILSKDRIYHVKFFKYLNYMHSNYLPLILLPRFNYPHQFVDDLLNVPEHEQVENKNGDSNSTSDSESSDSDHDINNDIDNAIEEEELLKALKRRGRFPKYLAPLFALSSRTHVPAYTQTLLWNYIISGQFLQFKDMISSLILTRPYSYDPMIQYMVGLNTYMEVLYIYTKLKSSDDGMTDEIELDKALKSVDVCKDEFKKVLELDSELIDLKDVLNQVDKLKERIIDLKSMDVNGRTRKKRKVESASASATSSEDSDSDSDSDSDTSHESS